MTQKEAELLQLREKNQKQLFKLPSFAAMMGTISKEAQAVVHIMLDMNAAVTETAIRRQLIEVVVERHKSQILSKYGLIMDNKEPMNNERLITYFDFFAPDRKHNDLQTDKYKDAGLNFRINLIKTFLSDSDLLKRDEKPLNMTQKIEIWIEALSNIAEIHSRATVSKLVHEAYMEGMINYKTMGGNKASRILYVEPHFYDLWKAR
jgi:hypothetical protein